MRLHITVYSGEFAISRFPPETDFDMSAVNGFCSVTRSDTELSVICGASAAPYSGTSSSGWRCMRVDDLLGLDTPGVLLAAIRPISDADISVFALATHDTDHLLVRVACLTRVEGLLRDAGHTVTNREAD